MLTPAETLSTILKLLGHSNIEIMDHYAHLARGSIPDAVERIADNTVPDPVWGHRPLTRGHERR